MESINSNIFPRKHIRGARFIVLTGTFCLVQVIPAYINGYSTDVLRVGYPLKEHFTKQLYQDSQLKIGRHETHSTSRQACSRVGTHTRASQHVHIHLHSGCDSRYPVTMQVWILTAAEDI